MTNNIQSLLEGITKRIEPVSDSAFLDAQVLLGRLINRPRTWVAAHGDFDLSPEQIDTLDKMVTRLVNGEPLPYVLGQWEFFGLEFLITPDVLIPRPETELLVEKAIAWLKAHPSKRRAIDVGTGSSCIAVALAVNIPDLIVTATDLSSATLKVARQNGERFRVADRIHYIECDLLPGNLQPSTFNLIVSNPPYIPTSTLKGLPVYGKEPSLALDGGADGMQIIRRLLALAPGALDREALILFEIEATLGRAALQLSGKSFPSAKITLEKDLSGLDRLIAIET
jgi:release factor glutamine methyltransferase